MWRREAVETLFVCWELLSVGSINQIQALDAVSCRSISACVAARYGNGSPLCGPCSLVAQIGRDWLGIAATIATKTRLRSQCKQWPLLEL